VTFSRFPLTRPMSPFTLRIVSVCLAFAAVLRAGVQFPTKPGEAVVAGQYLVRLKPGVAASLMAKYFPGASIQSLRALDLHVISLPAGPQPALPGGIPGA